MAEPKPVVYLVRKTGVYYLYLPGARYRLACYPLSEKKLHDLIEVLCCLGLKVIEAKIAEGTEPVPS